MRPGQEIRCARGINAQQTCNDMNRDWLCIGLEQIECVLCWHLIDQAMAQFCDFRTQSLDRTADKRTVDEPAKPGVDRWLALKHGVRFDRKPRCEMGFRLRPAKRLPGCDVQDITTKALVAKRARDIGKSGKAEMPVIFPDEGPAERMDLLIKRVGVLDEARLNG
jgi:hypothetical protein